MVPLLLVVKERAKTAADIADKVLDLRNRAKKHNYRFLTYYLEMAFHEAFSMSISSQDKKKPEPHILLEDNDLDV